MAIGIEAWEKDSIHFFPIAQPNNLKLLTFLLS